MSNLLILGAGGHGKVVAETALKNDKWKNVAFLDDNEELHSVIGIPVIGRLNDFILYKGKYKYAFVAIGNNKLRMKWIERLSEAGFIIPTIVHPFSYVSERSKIDKGSIIMAGAVVNADTVIGRGCIINTSSSVDHDCILDDGVHISPGVHIGGSAIIGKYTWICIGASIANNIRIGKDVTVAAGAAVVEDVPDNVLVAGVPAVIKKNMECY